MNSNLQITLKQTAFHKHIRTKNNTQTLKKDRQKFEQQINQNILQETFYNLTQESLNNLTSQMIDWKGEYEISEQQADTIITFLNQLSTIPYNFLITLFGKLSSNSQRRLIQSGIGNIAIFLPVQTLIQDVSLLKSYLVLLSKIHRPEKRIKQHFFSQDVISNIFKSKLQNSAYKQMGLALRTLTKEIKFICQKDQLYQNFINSLRHMVESISISIQNQCIIVMLQTLLNVFKSKDADVFIVLLDANLLERILYFFSQSPTTQQTEKLNYVIGSIYQVYPSHRNISQQQKHILLNYYPKFLAYQLAFLQSGKTSDECRLQIYSTIKQLILNSAYEDVLLTQSMFEFICTNIKNERAKTEETLKIILDCLVIFVINTDMSYLVKVIEHKKLVEILLQISCEFKWSIQLKGNTLMLIKMMMELKDLRDQFKRIPNSEGKLYNLKASLKQSTCIKTIDSILNLLQRQGQ